MSQEKKDKPQPVKIGRKPLDGHMILTNRELDRYAQGFVLLLGRLMPDQPKRQRANYFYKHCIRTAHETLQEELRPLELRQVEAPLIDDETDRLREMLAIRQESDALWDSEVEIPLPRKLLTEDDLPREIKGTIKGPVVNGAHTTVNGKDNATDNGRIVDLLTPAFYLLTNPDKEDGQKEPAEPQDEGGE